MKSEYHTKYYENVTRPKMGYKGRVRRVTDADKEYVKNNYLLKTSGAMAEEYGLTRLQIKHIMRWLKLRTTPEQRKTLKRKSTILSFDKLNKLREAGRINGKKNTNQYKDGEIIIRKNRDGKLEKHIRLANVHYQNRIIRLAVYNWENVNGKIPKGHTINFKDGDYLNPDIDNLVCLKRGVLFVKGATELSDNFVASVIAKHTELNTKDIPKDLIELKRVQLKLKRIVNEKNSQIKN